MNEQKKIEAMARADGYQWITPYDGLGQWNNKNLEQVDNLPDYLTDNEIDRMVRGLDDNDFHEYCKHLGAVCLRDDKHPWKAPSEEKVEAYLRAVGEWVSDCPQCNGTGLYLTDAQARYGDEPQPCSMCQEKGDE